MKSVALDPSHPGRISLAYRGLVEIPDSFFDKSEEIKELDLSHNKLSDPDLKFLQDFVNLHTLILDNNDLTSRVKFPFLAPLHLLWINHNKIENLSVFIETVAKCFPNLQFFSMMGNGAAPSYFNGGTFQQYKDYRCYVVSHLPSLLVLDDHTITAEEREEARKIYGYRRLSFSSKKPKKGKDKKTTTK